MEKLSERAGATLGKLRAEHTGKPGYIELKVIKGSLCIYESTSRWDKKEKRPKKIQHYLGRILEDGTFVRAKHRAKVPELEAAGPVESAGFKEETASAHETEDEIALLRHLSMNARMPLLELGKKVEMHRGIVYNRVKALEKIFDIRYVPEIDATKLGYMKYLLFIKFKKEIPPKKLLQDIFSAEPRIQFVMLIKGDYDVLAYMLAEDNFRATNTVNTLRLDTPLSGFKAEWHLDIFDETYGMVPLRDKFFELLREKIWSRTRDEPRPRDDQLTGNKYKVLRELNRDGSLAFHSIDERCGLNHGTSQYLYRRLKEGGVIKSTTINMKSLAMKYLAVIMLNIEDGSAYSKTKIEYIKDIVDDSNAFTNRYALVGDLGSVGSMINFLPIFKDGDLEAIEDRLSKGIRGVFLKSFLVSSVIVGSLCYRKFDNRYSRQRDSLVYKYRIRDYEKRDTYE
jgi:DNA-binding Lrp family transcriptional regulator